MGVRKLVISAVWLGLIPATAAAGLLEVEQKVFGMDCAPCAYSIEQGMKGLDGAREVSVSLNRGLARVRFEAGSQTRLDQLRAVVRRAGFTPKSARVRVSGRLSVIDRRPVLVTNAGETFHLEGPEAPGAAPSPGGRVTVSGRVAPDGPGRLKLEVRELQEGTGEPTG